MNQMTNDQLYANAEDAFWFEEGSPSAPHKTFLLIDLNCIYCHELYKEVKPLILSGGLQVRWLPVGLVKPGSIGKAANLLKQGSTEEKINIMRQAEENFDIYAEEGGIEGLSYDDNDPATIAAFDKAESNTEFLMQARFNGTPVMIFQDINELNNKRFVIGFVRGSEFLNTISEMANTF